MPVSLLLNKISKSNNFYNFKACQQGNKQIVDILLKNNAELDLKDAKGLTAIKIGIIFIL